MYDQRINMFLCANTQNIQVAQGSIHSIEILESVRNGLQFIDIGFIPVNRLVIY